MLPTLWPKPKAEIPSFVITDLLMYRTLLLISKYP